MRLAVLFVALAAPALAQPAVSDIQGTIANVQQQIDATNAEIAALEQQLKVMENQPPPVVTTPSFPSEQPPSTTATDKPPQVAVASTQAVSSQLTTASVSSAEGEAITNPSNTVIRAQSFLNTIGLNTHIDFGSWSTFGYENLDTVSAAINYLGIKNLRDSAQPGSTWIKVAQATGARFDAFINETSPDGMRGDLGNIEPLAKLGILNFLEGGNEEDDSYPANLGNNIYITAQFQQQVHDKGRSLGLPVINMSFGAGWTAANNWQGDYDKVGDLSAFTDFANAHTYANPGQTTSSAIQRLNGLALLAAKQRPVITTEIGWDETQGFGQDDVAKFALQATMDGVKAGNVKTYFYALFDDGSGKFGMMNKDGTPKPAGRAIHNLTTLLADAGSTAASFPTGMLDRTFGGMTPNDNSLLMQKSDGSYWMSLWNESDGPHDVTINLPGVAQVQVFDPLTGTGAVSISSTSAATVRVSDRPILLEIRPTSSALASAHD